MHLFLEFSCFLTVKLSICSSADCHRLCEILFFFFFSFTTRFFDAEKTLMLTVTTISIAALLVACAHADVDDVEQMTTASTYPKLWLSRYLHTEAGCAPNTEYEIYVRIRNTVHGGSHVCRDCRRSRSTRAPHTCPTTAPKKNPSS
jgi:hypothetical protein